MKKIKIKITLEYLERNAKSVPLLVDEIRDEILVVQRDSGSNAVSTVCPHMGGPLRYCAKDELLCEWHGWKFSTKSGACLNRNMLVQLNRYVITEHEGETWIEIV